jgi:hypothetical protein
MKNLLLFVLALAFFGCEDNIQEDKNIDIDYCEEARKHISECIGASLPELELCDEVFAKSILDQDCKNVIEYIFN